MNSTMSLGLMLFILLAGIRIGEAGNAAAAGTGLSKKVFRGPPDLPFSKAVKLGEVLYLSGQLGVDNSTKLVDGGFEPEFRRAVENVKNILAAAGSSLEKVVKVTVILTDLKNYDKMNTLFKEFFFAAGPPARVCYQAAGLWRGACVELEVVASC